MKLNHVLIFTLFVSIPILSHSQINYMVKGTVVSEDGYLHSGNIIALHPKDSSFIKGASFFEGAFELNDLKEEVILLQFSSLEFDDTFLQIRYEGNPINDLEEIRVINSGSALEEVVVNVKRPIYKQRTYGTLEISIENTALSSSNSVNEILSKSPGVVLNEEGQISVFGKGSAIYYQNGKRITEYQLALISPSSIKKIEIIRNPSSKYDAEGSAVFSITTKKGRNDGYQLNIQHNITHSSFGGTNTNNSLNLNYKKNKISINSYYSAQFGKEKMNLFTTRDREEQNLNLSSELNTNWNYNYDYFSSYGVGLQYDLNEKSYVSLEYSGLYERLGGNTVSSNELISNDAESFYRSDTNVDDLNKNNAVSLNYRSLLDALGSSIFGGLQYSKFDNKMDNDIIEKEIENANNSSGFLNNNTNLNIDIFTGQIDFTKILKNDKSFDLGLKYGYIANNFNFDFFTSENGTNFQLDANRSNDFDYKEAISAAYINYKGKLNDLNFSVGARAELTDYSIFISNAEHKDISEGYFNLFPNVSLSKTFSENKTLNFSYSSRINRAPYQHLNPILIYQDPFTSIQGNPQLKPERVHSFELNSKINKTFYTIGYNYTLEPLGNTVITGEIPNSYILKRINYGKENEFYLSANRTFRISRWWSSINTLSMKYTNLSEGEQGFESVNPKPNIYFFSNNRFKISDSFNSEISFIYNGKNYEGLHKRNDMYNLSFSLEKSLWDGKLKLRFIANDILHSYVASGNYSVGGTDVYYKRTRSSNYLRLSVIYNLSRLKSFDYKNNDIGKSEKDRTN